MSPQGLGEHKPVVDIIPQFWVFASDLDFPSAVEIFKVEVTRMYGEDTSFENVYSEDTTYTPYVARITSEFYISESNEHSEGELKGECIIKFDISDRDNMDKQANYIECKKSEDNTN